MPPRYGYRSTSVTFTPLRAAEIAAATPEGPPPTTTTSTSPTTLLRLVPDSIISLRSSKSLFPPKPHPVFHSFHSFRVHKFSLWMYMRASSSRALRKFKK
jgi:hypothetical protein